MPSALHFVLQFVKQPAELRRVLLGARESDRPIVRAAEVSVQEAVQFDGRALKSSRAPYEAPPRHSVVFLFHRFWFFLILAGLCAVGARSNPSVRPRHTAVE
jgi:apolipoprotein N-acyltransferase